MPRSEAKRVAYEFPVQDGIVQWDRSAFWTTDVVQASIHGPGSIFGNGVLPRDYRFQIMK